MSVTGCVGGGVKMLEFFSPGNGQGCVRGYKGVLGIRVC